MVFEKSGRVSSLVKIYMLVKKDFNAILEALGIYAIIGNP